MIRLDTEIELARRWRAIEANTDTFHDALNRIRRTSAKAQRFQDKLDRLKVIVEVLENIFINPDDRPAGKKVKS